MGMGVEWGAGATPLSAEFWSILVEGHSRHISVKLFLKSVHWSKRRCHLKVFPFLVMVAILFSGVEPF